MRILALMENTCGRQDCKIEHGLSLYIETAGHKLLADTGASPAFMENAKTLGVDLDAVDTVIISHGHYDHAGGLMEFCRAHPRAKVWMQRLAGEDYYHGDRYIGIDKRLLDLPQVRLLDRDVTIDEELSLFTGITGRRCFPEGNRALRHRRAAAHMPCSVCTDEPDSFADEPDSCVDEPDSFAHEQCLVIQEGERRVLISGCAHNGILNILDRYREQYHGEPDVVISGFHMMKKTEYTEAERQVICDTAEELAGYRSVFYTGHCTGEAAIALMRPVMGEKLKVLHCGMEMFL